MAPHRCPHPNYILLVPASINLLLYMAKETLHVWLLNLEVERIFWFEWIKWILKSKNREPFQLWSEGDMPMEEWSLPLPVPTLFLLHSTYITMWQAEYGLLKDTHCLIPWVCDYVMLHGNKEFRLQMEFKFANVLTFKWGDYFWIIPVDSRQSEWS